METLTKSQAIALLGGTVTAAARALNITPASVSGWPDPLTADIRNRVQAWQWRFQHGLEPDPYASSKTSDAQEV